MGILTKAHICASTIRRFSGLWRRRRLPGPTRVSVVVVTYNHEKFIAETLNSILGQITDFAFEVIVSEDCSTDSTRRILMEYCDANPKTVKLVLSRENLNTNFVLERAVRAAAGEYIAIVDGDDYWISKHKLQRQADFLDCHSDFTL